MFNKKTKSMKQIKKVVLKEAIKLSQEEMKQVFGGSGIETESGAIPKPKVEACRGKKVNDFCFWYTASGTMLSGICQRWWSPTLHCSDLNRKPFKR